MSSDVKEELTMLADHQKVTLSNKLLVDGRKKITPWLFGFARVVCVAFDIVVNQSVDSFLRSSFRTPMRTATPATLSWENIWCAYLVVCMVYILNLNHSSKI
jgi:hypothetical protein